MKNLSLILLFIASFVFGQTPIRPSVTVNGKGSVMLVPDLVNISVNINNEGYDVKTVKAENDKIVSNVLNFLRLKGLNKKNYKTQHVNLSKSYDFNSKEYKIQASQSISILLENINRYDEVMQGLLEVGINEIEYVNFDVKDKEKYQLEVRRKAVLDAKKKASEYAQALGQDIGKAIYINDVSSSNLYRKTTSPMMLLSESSNQGSTSTLSIGEISIDANIAVTFELR